MFALALVFLICQAILVVLWADVPNWRENALSVLDPTSDEASQIRASLNKEVIDHRIGAATAILMLLIWPVVLIESVWHWLTRPWNRQTRSFHGLGLVVCLCPSLRMCARSPEMHYRMWLPGLGWRQPNKRLQKRLEHIFSLPMIGIAMLILPVLMVEFFMKTQVAQHTWLRMLLHVSTGVIWFAFAAEFILMISVSEKKLAYCKKHWVDLAIILLPILSFLRSLQMLRTMRMTKLLRAQQLTKFARVYRLRGTTVKTLRALVLLELFTRFTHSNPERVLEKLRRQLGTLEADAKQIRRQIAKLERQQREEATERASASAAKLDHATKVLPQPVDRQPSETRGS